MSEGKGGITLTLPEQSKHEYTGYDGYTLRAVVLDGRDGQKMGLILRSKEKR